MIQLRNITLALTLVFTITNNVSFAQSFEDLNIDIPAHYEFSIQEIINEDDGNTAYMLASDRFPSVANISLTLLVRNSKNEIDSNSYFLHLEDYFTNINVDTTTLIINDKRYLFAAKNYQKWEDSGDYNYFLVAHTHHQNKTYAFIINVENDHFLGWLRNLIHDVKFINN